MLQKVLFFIVVAWLNLTFAELLPAQDLVIKQLPNGILNIKEDKRLEGGVSIRVLIKVKEDSSLFSPLFEPTQTATSGSLLFSLDLPAWEKERAAYFLGQCRGKINEFFTIGDRPFFLAKENGYRPLEKIKALSQLDSIAVILVGDVSKHEWEDLLYEKFGDLEAVIGEEAMHPLGSTAALFSIRRSEQLSEKQAILYISFVVPDKFFESHLKNKVSLALFQKMLSRRLEGVAASFSPKITEPYFLLPEKRVSIAIKCNKETVLPLLKRLLDEEEKMKAVGFSEEEFYLAKDELREKLQIYLARMRSDLYVDQWNKLQLIYSPEEFGAYVMGLLDEMPSSTFQEHSHFLLREEYRFCELIYPASLPEAQLPTQEILYREGIAALPPPVRPEDAIKEREEVVLLPSEEIHFLKLPINDKEKQHIHEIISAIAEHNLVSLLLKKGSMEKKGSKIGHVHPLRFLSTIFMDPYLKSCMKEIHESSFKWSHLVDGVAKRMKEEAGKGNLICYIPSFAKALGVDQTAVMQFIKSRDYDGLVAYLAMN